ncbi:type II secretion system protein [Desulfohalobiaceae bacterium Ax17]|jgi:prepilin-type N-terminal cleavage/methylation domain-containing protein|uniref:type II secretion system protein n=1 Tax=Desulfovulcanus ferrireducens TaxID=2831190 RepID=UPI00207B9F30|nr:type II secretion system protein [Desulfovulcanus ferrireducens]MBT8764141.1 type II secretion system protein [Desulfovulcanus ferrireducens]
MLIVSRLNRTVKNGFTLVELALVLVIVGLLIGGGVLSWTSLMQARKIAATRSALNQAKDCLFRRIAYTNKYPDYTPAPDCSSVDQTKDVDVCLCGIKDAWGNRLRFLEGLEQGGDGLSQSSDYVIANLAQDQARATISPDSKVIDVHNKERTGVAFILISFGKNGQADDSSYGDRFVSSDTLAAALDPDNPPNFYHPDDASYDDLALIVTASELQALFD